MRAANPFTPESRPRGARETVVTRLRDDLGHAMVWCQDRPLWQRLTAAALLVGGTFALCRVAGPAVAESPLVPFMPAVMVSALMLGDAAYVAALASVVLARLYLSPAPPAWSGSATRGSVAALLLLSVAIAIARELIAEVRRRPGWTDAATVRAAERDRRARDSQARWLADAVESAAFGIAIADPVTDRIRFANRAYALLRGIAVRDLIGKPVIQAYAATEVPRIPIMMETADRMGHVEFDTAYVRPDASIVPVRKGITSVRNDAGTVRYRLIYAIDTTPRKRAEEAGRESEARFRATFEQAAVGIAHLDLGGRILRANDRFCTIAGYPREELLRRRSQDLVLPGDLDRGRAGWDALLDGRAAHHSVDRRIIQSGGAQVWVRVTTSLVRDEGGGRAYLMQVLVDISEQKKSESALQHLNKMDAIGNLAGGIAHDFNNMLGVVSGNLELLVSMREQDPELQSLAGEAIEAVMRGADLTRRLLSFSRRQPLNPRPVDINALLRNVAPLLQRSLRDDITVSLDLESGVWRVLADPGQIEAAVTNLAANARDAMPSGGRIRIATANERISDAEAEAAPDGPAGDYVVIEVADNGSGIPAEILPHVFEPFFTTKAPGAGTGLGLAMVFGFVRQSDGFVRLTTAPGEGTAFRLFLPRALGVDSRALPAEMADTPPRGSETILVAEDNAQLRAIMKQQLIGLGYQVLEAGEGPVALRLIERAAVDLLITDVTMPGGMTGFDLAREARAVLPALPILISSAHSDALPDDEGQQAYPVLHKPFRALELARAVREALGG